MSLPLRARPALAHRALAALIPLGLLLPATAGGAPIHETSLAALHGETFDVPAPLVALPQGTAPEAGRVKAAGATPGKGIELTPAAPALASPGVAAGHFAYRLTLQERSPTALTQGIFRVELFVDGESRGAVYVRQASAATTLESVRVAWDLGPMPPRGNASIRVSVTPH